MALQFAEGFRDFAVLGVAVAIDKEEIFPRLALAGTAFDFRHVQLVTAERSGKAKRGFSQESIGTEGLDQSL